MKKILNILIISLVIVITQINVVHGETLEELLNNLVGPKEQYNTKLSPVYLKNNITEENINPRSGELTLTQTDFTLEGRNGLDLEIKRIYKSGISNVQEMKVKYVNGAWVDYVESTNETSSFYEDRYNLGIGMRFSFPGIEVRENSNGTSYKYLHTETGDVYRLEHPDDIEDMFLPDGQPILKPKEVYLPEGQTIEDAVILIKEDFSNGQADGTSKYLLIRKDGQKTYFSEDGRILGIVDRYGNTITFKYTTLSYSIDGTTIEKRLLSNIIDTLGREVTIEYKQDSSFTVGSIENNQYTLEDSYKASQNPNTTDSGDLQGKYQVIVNLPGNKKIIYDKSAVLVSDSKHVLRTRIQSVFDVDGKPKYHFWYEQTDLGFTYTNGTSYSAYNRYENLTQIDNFKTNKITRYIYDTFSKSLNNGSMQYRKIFAKDELVVNGFDDTKDKFLDKFVYETINRIDYSYVNESDGFGYEGYKGQDENYLENIYRYKTNIQDMKGNIARYTFDGLHQLITTENEGNDHREIITTEHDEMKLIKKKEITNYDVKNGEESGRLIKNIENFRYDKYGNLTNYTGPEAKRDQQGYPLDTDHTTIYSYAYDKYHVPTHKTWKKDSDTTCQIIYTVDDIGNIIKEERINADDREKSIITDYQYDNYGNLAQKKVNSEENTYISYYEYGIDADGVDQKGAYLTKEYKIYQGEEITNTYSYDFNTGAITAEINPKGSRTDYNYDILSRVIKVINEDGSSKEYVYKEYQAKNKEIEFVDSEGNRFLYEYDIQGNLVKSSAYDNNKWNLLKTIEYDSHSNKTKEIDSNGHSVVYEYDSKDRLTKKYFFEDDKISKSDIKLDYITGYDEETALLVTLTNEEGYIQKFYYDILNRLIKKEVTPDNENLYTFSYTYDYVGNKLTTTDGKLNTTKYQYDSLGRLIKQIDAMGNETTYSYNSLNRVLTKTEPGEKIIEYDYDSLGRIKQEKVYKNGDQNYTFKKYEYDVANNLINSIEGNVISGIATISSNISYSYDDMNRRTGEYTKIDENRTGHTNYQYNNINKLIKKIEYIDKEKDKYIEYTYDYDFAGRIINEEGIYLEGNGGLQNHGNYNRKYTYDYAGNLTKEERLNGGVYDTITYNYDYRNRVIERIEPFKEDGSTKTTKYQYDRKGNLLSEIITRQGIEISKSYKYDGLDRVIWEMDSLLNITRYAYDENDNIIKKVEPIYFGTPMEEAPGIEYQYDALNRRISNTLFDGETRSILEYREYNKRGNPVKISDGEGYDIENPSNSLGDIYIYDIYDRVIEQTTAQTALDNKLNGTHYISQKYTYNSHGNVLSKEDANGNKTIYDYYLSGKLKEILHPDGNSESYDYDLTGRMEKTLTDRRGNSTRVYNNVFGKVYRKEYPDGTTEEFEYSTKGLLTSRIDRLGNSTYYKYDFLGNEIEKKEYIKSDNNYRYYKQTQKTYDEGGLLLSKETFEQKEPLISGQQIVTLSAGDKVEYIYDKAGRVVNILGPNNRETIKEYDQNGNITEVKQKIDDQPYNYNIVKYEYDIRNQLIQESTLVKADNIQIEHLINAEYDEMYHNRVLSIATYSYYLNGKLKSKIDPNGNTTDYHYDYDKRLIKKLDPLELETVYVYDLRGNLVEQTNAKEVKTYYEYDEINRLIKKIEPSADDTTAVTRYIYDEAGNLIKEISPKYYEEQKDTKELVQTMKGYSYVYDEMNRKVQDISPEGHTLKYIKYDDNGNVKRIVDGIRYTGDIDLSLGTEYNYDGLGRLISKTDPLNNTSYYQYDILGNLIESTDERGNTTAYEYNSDGTLKQVIYPDTGKVSYTYDYLGRIIIKTDQRNNTTEYQYNSFGKLKRTLDPDGYIISYLYDLKGNILAQTDKRESTTILKYDKNDRLIQKKAPLYIDNSKNIVYLVDEYIYDNVGNILRKSTYGSNDPSDKRQINYTYYSNNSVKTITDNGGGYTKKYYDKNSNVIKTETLIQDEQYLIQKFEYDSSNILIKAITLVDENSIYNIEEIPNIEELRDEEYPSKIKVITGYEYNILGNKTREIMPMAYHFLEADTQNRKNNTISYEYDELNRIKKIITNYQSQEIFTEYIYDEAGNKIKGIDPRGNTTTYTYDELNRLEDIIDVKGNKFTTSYDLAGNKEAQTNAKGHTITYTYDKLNRHVLTIDPYEKVISKKIYDKNGNITKVIDAKGYLSTDNDYERYGTEYIYDLGNRLIQIIDPEAKEKNTFTTKYTYSVFGERTEITDALGNTTKYNYDKVGRLKEVINPDNTAVIHHYDKIGSKLYTINAKGKTTKYSYNNLGWLTETINPENQAIKYQYDLGGNTAYITDRNGNHIKQSFDNRNLLIFKEVIETWDKITYDYDKIGNRIEMTDESGTYTYFYDSIYQLEEIKKDGQIQIAYTYDTIGNIQLVKDKNNNTTTYTFDKSSRLQTVAYEGKITNYSYDENSNIKEIEYSNKIKEVFTYNKNNQLLKLENKGIDGSTISQYIYTYDLAGRQKTKTDSYGITSYDYDTLGRIQKVQAPGKTSIYSYDKAGNRESLNETYTSEQTSDYTDQITGQAVKYKIKKSQYIYSDSDRLLRLIEGMYDEANNLVLEKTTNYLYDNNGNELKQQISYLRTHTIDKKQVTKGSVYGDDITHNTNSLIQKHNKTYDGFNRLKTVEKIQGGTRTTVEYSYNGDGLRTSKKARNSEEGYEEKVTNYIYDRQHVILETDENNNTITRYVRGLTYIASVDNTNNSSYYLYNGHGDVVQTINEAGEIQNQYDYDIFGNPILTIEISENSIRYAGEFYDEETGLYYLRARYYNPYIGRFISEDSYWGEDSNTLSLNLYTYGNNNPIRYIDPSGHNAITLEDMRYQALMNKTGRMYNTLANDKDEDVGNDGLTLTQRAVKNAINELKEQLRSMEEGLQYSAQVMPTDTVKSDKSSTNKDRNIDARSIIIDFVLDGMDQILNNLIDNNKDSDSVEINDYLIQPPTNWDIYDVPIETAPDNYNNAQKVQYYLSEMGFDIGTFSNDKKANGIQFKKGDPMIDGAPGVKTYYSLIIFQYYNNHYNEDKPLITGYINKETIEGLRQAAQSGVTYDKIMDSDLIKNWHPEEPSVTDKSRNGTISNDEDFMVRVASKGGPAYLQKEAAVAWALLVNEAIQYNNSDMAKLTGELNINKFKASGPDEANRSYEKQIEYYIRYKLDIFNLAATPKFDDEDAAVAWIENLKNSKDWVKKDVLPMEEILNQIQEGGALAGYGGSNHGMASAIDFTLGDNGSLGGAKGYALQLETRWLEENAGRFGFTGLWQEEYIQIENGGRLETVAKPIKDNEERFLYKETWHWDYMIGKFNYTIPRDSDGRYLYEGTLYEEYRP